MPDITYQVELSARERATVIDALRLLWLKLLANGHPDTAARDRRADCEKLTREIAQAAAWDAGNRHMREHGRTVWSVEDWNAACAECERLLTPPPIPDVSRRFGYEVQR